MKEVPALPVLEPRKLDTPIREQLLAKYRKIDAFSKSVLIAEAVIGLLVLAWTVWKAPGPFSWFPWAAATMGALGVFRWVLYNIFLNKKRLEDIRPDVRFGEHTRDSLLKLTAGVFTRLGLNPKQVPVFLIREKDVNASAVRCELWPGMHLFNGVFLNRSIIHLLDERELASVVGHELGHVIPYAPLISRCYLVHSLFAGILSFAIVAAIPHPGALFFVPFAVLWLLSYVIAYPHACLSRGIEFLCDDYGAQAAGLLAALSCEFKMAAENETREQLMMRLLEAKKKGIKCSLQDLVKAYDEAIPFGKADPKLFEQEFQKFNSQTQKAKKEISVGGFLDHLQGEEDADSVNEWIDEQLKKHEAINSLPVIEINRTPYLQGSNVWSQESAEQLANAIAAEPTKLLFRSRYEITDQGATHPNPSRRMLFLWRNRAAYG